MEPQTPKLILVPADFSAPSAHAVRHAAALGERFGAHLLVIHADTFVPPVDFTAGGTGAFNILRDDMVEAAREQLQTFAETNITASVPYDVRVIVSSPHDAILSQAHESGANLIVMGTHGRTGLRRLLFGSVTEGVIRQASVPVLAVNESASDGAGVEVVVGRSTTAEARAASWYAGLLAGDDARFVDVPDDVDILSAATREGADLIAMGVTGEGFQRSVLQQSSCPVLTVNPLTARMLESQQPPILQQRVVRELQAGPNVRIQVPGNDIVTLDGFVHTFAEKCVLEESARRMEGVAGVVNRLDVRLTIGDYRTDATLQRVLRELIDALARMPSERPRVTVSDGIVQLEGNVPMAFQRELVENTVREVAGIRGIRNLITVGVPATR